MRELRDDPTQERSALARVAAGAGVFLAIGLVALVLFGQGGGYQVKATFQNASQLVEGNDVRLGGVAVGSVEALELADDGRAEVTMSIDDDHAPLDRATQAVIRQTSLSGIANRYVDLHLPTGSSGDHIDDGGRIDEDNAKSAVEIDSVVNLFNPETRRAVRRFIRGSADALEGEGAAARRGFEYLNPALASSRGLFEQLAADTVLLDRFVVDSARLVTNVAARRDDVSALVGNLNATTDALGADQAALSQALTLLPDFMRRANSTFVNLRAALDDVDPLVRASRPAAAELRRFLPELRVLARDAEPTVRDLSRTIRARGRDNDVVDLLRTFPRLANVAIESAQRNGAERPGAFPQTADALTKAAPVIGFGRPYSVDFLGWFDDFSHTGGFDAIGGYSRSQVYVNLFSPNVPAGVIPDLLDPQERLAQFTAVNRPRQFKRCPGHSEAPAADGSNVYSAEEAERLDCNPDHRAVGP